MSDNSRKLSELNREDWGVIARNPKFIELSKRKMSFLVGWWLCSTIFYFILPVAAGFAVGQGDFLNRKVIGHVNVVYLFALSQYILCLFIAIYYAFWANKTADRLTRELLAELNVK